MKYTINTYDINGKFTAMEAFEPKPLLFDSEEDAKEYLRKQGCREDYIEDLSIEEYNPEEWK